MAPLDTSNQPTPVWGILSVILALLGLLILVYFVLFGGIPYTIDIVLVIEIALLIVLGVGLLAGLRGVIQNEQPGWLSLSGLVLTICIGVAATLLIRWLIG